MTSILTLPSHMTGFLHELGTQSGIYRWGMTGGQTELC